MKKGDWICICKELNFASRINCRKCGTSKNAIESNVPNTDVNKEVPKDKEEADNTCIICFDREINTVVTICGHLGYCYECALTMTQCPVCRKDYDPDTNLVKVFKVK